MSYHWPITMYQLPYRLVTIYTGYHIPLPCTIAFTIVPLEGVRVYNICTMDGGCLTSQQLEQLCRFTIATVTMTTVTMAPGYHGYWRFKVVTIAVTIATERFGVKGGKSKGGVLEYACSHQHEKSKSVFSCVLKQNVVQDPVVDIPFNLQADFIPDLWLFIFLCNVKCHRFEVSQVIISPGVPFSKEFPVI